MRCAIATGHERVIDIILSKEPERKRFKYDALRLFILRFEMSSSNLTTVLIDLSTIDPKETVYGYIPNQTICYILVVLFGVSTFAHLCQGLWLRMWWTLPTIVLAGLLEVLGWSGRLWSSYNPLNDNAFMIQIVCTILGPTPLLAANFITMGAIIRILGPIYSRVSPRKYSIFFVSCDVVSLIVQGVGGGIAASSDDDRAAADLGGNIMLGGIVFQLAVITLYSCVAIEFFWCYIRDIPFSSKPKANSGSQVTLNSYRGEMTTPIRVMVGALIFNLLCLFIRAIYRTIELSDGWNGRIITTEVYFNVLDGAMIILALYTFNLAHPGFFLGRDMDKAVEQKDSSSLQMAENNA